MSKGSNADDINIASSTLGGISSVVTGLGTGNVLGAGLGVISGGSSIVNSISSIKKQRGGEISLCRVGKNRYYGFALTKLLCKLNCCRNVCTA